MAAAVEAASDCEVCEPAFLAWCTAHGLETHNIKPAYVAEGWRGVVATQRIAFGDVLVAAPEPLLMTGRSARRDAALGALLRQQEYVRISDHQVRLGGCAVPFREVCGEALLHTSKSCKIVCCTGLSLLSRQLNLPVPCP
jgi:hypothetical protein